MKDLEGKMDPADKAKLESELANFKKVRESNDASQIKSAMEEFSKATYDVFGKVYQQAAQEQQAQQAQQPNGPADAPHDDNVVDADYEVVNDDK